jgi:SecD/SecF fusion protein
MGLITGIAGFILVAIFIQLLYGVWGLIANVALLLHTLLTFAALSLIGATLTLPGIAGIILGIGIAVDANILINERIREETKRGLGAMAALDRGFHSAFATIVDSNVTSLISTLLLFMFGTGPVRGFAVAMMLGIVISMFTDVTLVRMAMGWYVRRRKLKVLRIEPLVRIAPENPNFRFMNARFFGIGVSIVLSIASIALFFKPGLNYGIDFKGGIQAEITTSQPADLAQLREKLGGLGLGEVALQSAGSPNDVLIRIQRQDGGEEAQTVAVNKMRDAVTEIDPGVKIERTEVVGPKVSGELARSGFIAVVLSALGMLIYLWWRFEWFFAVGAIITLILDTTKMVGFFALLQLDFNLTAIAALLTAIGYSVNDKVVVYDRMRENMRLYKTKPLREIVDMSINQVLVRCIYTSVVTFLCLLPMAIWGGSAVHNFAVPMLFGIFIATTSSIFIAAPILLLLGNWWQHRREAHQALEDNTAAQK